MAPGAFLVSSTFMIKTPFSDDVGLISAHRRPSFSVQAHTCASPLSTSVALNLEAVIPNFIIHEHHCNNLMKFNKGLTKYDPQPVNGRFEIPNEPGIGNEISDQAFENAAEYAVIE